MSHDGALVNLTALVSIEVELRAQLSLAKHIAAKPVMKIEKIEFMRLPAFF